MKILFLHEVNYLAKPIFEMHEFPEYLATLGHEVGFMHFPEDVRCADLQSIPRVRKISGRVLENVEITLFTPRVPYGGLLGRLVAAIRYVWETRTILEDFRPDVVVTYSVPTSGWQMVRQCNRLGIPVMYRAIDASHKIRRNIFSPLVRIAEIYVASRATHVSVHNSAMREYVIRLGAKPEHVSNQFPIIRLIGDGGNAKSREGLREELGIPSSSNVLVFMGTFFPFAGLKEVIRAFSEELNGEDYLLLIGDGGIRSDLEREVRALELESRVIFTGIIPFEKLRAYLQVGDVAINPFKSVSATNVALPNKVLQYMAAKLPVVSTKLRGLAFLEILGAPGFLTVDKPEETIAEAFELVRSGADLRSLGQKNFETISELLDPDRALHEFERQLRTLAGKAL
ncbi:MAG: glycosyltransferase [Actinomycetota bacterium]